MSLPNIPISSRVSSSKGTGDAEKTEEKPSGRVDPEKFRQIFEVEERKNPHGAILDEEEIDPEKAKEKKFGQKEKKTVESKEDKKESASIFEVARESKESSSKKMDEDRFAIPPFNAASSMETEVSPSLSVDATSQASSIKGRIERIEKIQEIIDKITQEILHLESAKNGETVTLIYLKDDTPFKGASIKISEFDTAKGQFNITIDNLTPDAKELVESQAQKLIDKLSEMGYQVPNFVATSSKINERITTHPSERPTSSFTKDKDEEKSRQENKPKR